MSMETARAALAAKEAMLRFLVVDFDRWAAAGFRSTSQQAGSGPDPDIEEIRQTTRMRVRTAEVFAIEPVMSQVVKMAAEDLPDEAAFLADDLPCETGTLFLSEPFTLAADGSKPGSVTTDLEAILWQVTGSSLLIQVWARPRSVATTGPQPVTQAVARFGQPLKEVFDPRRGTARAEISCAALTHTLSALRIMQQPYAGHASTRAPRSAARRLDRHGAHSDITVISFRQQLRPPTETADETAWKLDHRVLVRGHWRRHQRYKTPDGDWAEKQIYIGPYVRGPEGTPLVVTRKVNDLIR